MSVLKQLFEQHFKEAEAKAFGQLKKLTAPDAQTVLNTWLEFSQIEAIKAEIEAIKAPEKKALLEFFAVEEQRHIKNIMPEKLPEEIETPTPEEIKKWRADCGLTQEQAGSLVHVKARNWYRWETGEYKMGIAEWELFLIKARHLKK